MERRTRQPMLIDGLTAGLGGPRSATFFAKIEAAVPWAELAASIKDLFPHDDPHQAGRPHWPLVTMIKCVMLAKWFGLSDPELEELLQDRFSFRRFVGLSLGDATPDETTFVRFRKRLLASGHVHTLFETTLAHLCARGLVVKGGTLVDATLIEAPLGHKRPDGTKTTDPVATKTVKHGRTYHGYKAHVATDRRGLITDYVFDTASSSDHRHADDLMKAETQAVYADSGYRSQARQAALEARGVFCGIVYGRVKGQKELTPAQRAHNRQVAGIRAPVEHAFGWLRKMGFWRARYRGLIRNAVDFALRAIAYNWKRSLSLAPVRT